MGKDNFFAYLGVIAIQLISTGQSLLSKATISEGMKPAIFVTYILAFGTLFLAPFAFFLERKTPTTLTLKLLCKICFISFVGICLNLNLFFSVFNYASATFVIAMNNIIPMLVFIIAVILRLETLGLRQWHGKAKVLGCIVCLSGAMVFTFVKGPPLYHVAVKETASHSSTSTHFKEDYVKGFFLMFSATLTMAFWLIMQASVQKEFSAKFRLTAIQCCFSSIMSALWAAATQRNISSWKLGWDVNLLTVFYCGILVSGIMYWLQIWVVDKRGPVFASMFSPLSLVSTAILSALIFKEILYWGSVLGAIMLLAGLYSFLWGKNKETEAQKYEEKPKQSKDDIVLECITTCTPVFAEPDKKEGGNH